MATINFLIQSQKENANIYVRFTNGRKTVLKKKTGFIIDPKDWNSKKGIPITKSESNKVLKITLDKLATHLENALNTSVANGKEIDANWLSSQIDLFNNKTEITDLDILTNYIQKYIDDSPYKRNQRGGIGFSPRRVTGLKTFQNLYLRFEKEVFGNKKIKVREVDIQFVEKFKRWLIDKNGYNTNYVGRNVIDLKTICNDAKKNGIEVSKQIDNIKGISENKKTEDILYLNFEELNKIKYAEIESEALINARKWLLLGCAIGQRAGDLLNISSQNIKSLGEHSIIELKQEKTGKLVAIPILKDARDIINSGMPYKISQTKFNEYIKEVCKIADISNVVTGKVKEHSREAMKLMNLPKYNFVSTHICRRSFATNYYITIPTQLLMRITGHSTEKMFLKYIGKTEYDSATQMLDILEKVNNL